MRETSHRVCIRHASIVSVLVLSLSWALPARADDATSAEPARPNVKKTVTVGKAKLTWNLVPTASAKHAGLVAAFKQATDAHLSGTEPFATPGVEPETLPAGQLMLPLPVELIHAMFIRPGGRTYCSDSTVTVKTNAGTNAVEEDR